MYLHRFILNAPDELQVDHRDGNTFNNTRENLRLCTCSQNNQNKGKISNNRFKGIWYEKSMKKWRARVQLSHKKINLGCFKTEEEAHVAYVAAAKKYHGEFYHA